LRQSSRSEVDVAQAIWDSGVDCLPISIYCDQQELRPGIMFGFACATEAEIGDNVRKLAAAIGT